MPLNSIICAEKKFLICNYSYASMLILRIGQLIRILRENAGLEQGDLGMHHTTISKIERGKTEAKRPTIEIIAKKLNTTPAEIDGLLELINGRLALNPQVKKSYCPEGIEEHNSLHQVLERALHDESKLARLVMRTLSVVDEEYFREEFPQKSRMQAERSKTKLTRQT